MERRPFIGQVWSSTHIVLATSQQKSITRPTAILGQDLETRLFLTPHPISNQKVLGCFSFQNYKIRLRIIMWFWKVMIIPLGLLGSGTCILKLVNHGCFLTLILSPLENLVLIFLEFLYILYWVFLKFAWVSCQDCLSFFSEIPILVEILEEYDQFLHVLCNSNCCHYYFRQKVP